MLSLDFFYLADLGDETLVVCNVLGGKKGSHASQSHSREMIAKQQENPFNPPAPSL